MTVDALLETGLVPDALVRAGIRRIVRSRLAEEDLGSDAANAARRARWIQELRRSPIAVATRAANEQHYEVPAEFFDLVLGPRRKYSACYYGTPGATLADAEESMLRLTAERAEIADGQRVLELGCGWGSLTLWMAEHYPTARITAVSNSRSQKAYIDAAARRLGVTNVAVITADMNDFDPADRFDRVVSVEMFEHMRNYEALDGPHRAVARAVGSPVRPHLHAPPFRLPLRGPRHRGTGWPVTSSPAARCPPTTCS